MGRIGYFKDLVKEAYSSTWCSVETAAQPLLIYHQWPPYDQVFPDFNAPERGRLERKLCAAPVLGSYALMAGIATAVQFPSIVFKTIKGPPSEKSIDAYVS